MRESVRRGRGEEGRREERRRKRDEEEYRRRGEGRNATGKEEREREGRV